MSVNVTSENFTCMIQGADIVAPKIRIAIYVQSSLLFVKIIAGLDKVVKLVVFGLITSLAIMISSIIQYRNNNLHYIFQIEATYLASLLVTTIYCALFVLTVMSNEERKKLSLLGLLSILVSIIMTCYNIWLWTTIKWNLPLQECSDNVKVFWLTIPLNPIGWVRDFTLAMSCFGLLNVFYIPACLSDEDNEGYNENRTFISFFIAFALLLMAFTIASSEILIHKNPISEFPSNWSIKEIVILVMAGGDSIATIYSLLKLNF
jgi:hypothetical protein